MSSTSNGLVKNAYRRVLLLWTSVFGVEAAKKADALFRFHRRLNLKNPQSLADKVSWIELNTDQEEAARLTDKIDVRRYIEDKGLDNLLVPICGGPWSDVSEIDYERLPSRFVLKAAHGCEMNLICKDKSRLDSSDFFKKASLWLDSDYARACIEPHYLKIPHRLFCEEYLEAPGGIVDYKIHCFSGEPSFILTCSEREHGLKLNLFDTDWMPITGLKGPMKNTKELPAPSKLDEMLDISRVLSRDFEFVRVDLYEVEGRIYFGELTFSPAAGVFPYFTESFVNQCGTRLSIDGLGASDAL